MDFNGAENRVKHIQEDEQDPQQQLNLQPLTQTDPKTGVQKQVVVLCQQHRLEANQLSR